jgi:soluble lytic murein transglycosylase-like protein
MEKSETPEVSMNERKIPLSAVIGGSTTKKDTIVRAVMAAAIVGLSVWVASLKIDAANQTAKAERERREHAEQALDAILNRGKQGKAKGASVPIAMAIDAGICGAMYSVDPVLILAVSHRESAGDDWAISSIGAVGRTQIAPINFAELEEVGWIDGPSDLLLDPRAATCAGAYFLREFLDRRGSRTLALAEYNAGGGNLPAGARYAERVLETYRSF